MCQCAVKKKKLKSVATVKNSWRLSNLFRIEKLIRNTDQERRAKRMGICGNTIFVKAIKENLPAFYLNRKFVVKTGSVRCAMHTVHQFCLVRLRNLVKICKILIS